MDLPLRKNSCSKFLGLIDYLRNEAHKFDPTCSAVVTALKFTFACIIGSLVMVFFNNGMTFFVAFVPAVSFFTIIPHYRYKDKFLSLISFLGFMTFLQMIFAVTYDYPTAMILITFFIIFIAVAKTKYRYSVVFAVLWAVIYLTFPQNIYYGLNRVIEDAIIFAIVIILIYFYEFVFSKFLLKRHIVYLIELVSDLTILATSLHLENTMSELQTKYVSDTYINFKPEIEVEKILKSVDEKLFHRILMEMINKGKFINNEEFHFKKNRVLKKELYPIYIILRRIFRDFSLIIENKIECENIRKNFIETEELLDLSLMLIYEFKSSITSASKLFSYETYLKKLELWMKKYLEFYDSKNPLNDRSHEILLGFKYYFSDVASIGKLLKGNFNIES